MQSITVFVYSTPAFHFISKPEICFPNALRCIQKTSKANIDHYYYTGISETDTSITNTFASLECLHVPDLSISLNLETDSLLP